MKTKLLLFLVSAFCSLQIQAQTFQKSVTTNDQRHFHDLNIEPANDGTDDYFVCGNLFDASMQNYTPFLQRVDASGTVIWHKDYTVSLPKARFFDIEPYQISGLPSEVAITGSIDVNGVKNVFIAKVNAATGAMVNAKSYSIPNPSFNSRGLHISYVINDANGDGLNEEGFVVGGFNSDSYAVSTGAANAGFVMRVYGTLGVFWVLHTNSTSGSQDFDAVNNITETSDGYFLTGSTNDVNTGQLSILAQKIDFQGNLVWNKSHVFGNSQDVSVDAYYEASTDQIYMLSNYSATHLFGVAVLDNVTGNINSAQSWVATSNELNRYGFTLMESFQNSNNLVITGYDRTENWTDSAGNNHFGQSNIFVYEFEKGSGNPVSANYQYLVTHSEPSGDEFNFWNGQMPLIYYPDISFGAIGDDGLAYYFHVGYKTDPSITYTEADLFKTLPDKINDCDKLDIAINPTPTNFDFVNATAVITDEMDQNIQVNPTELPTISSDCTPTLSVGSNDIENLNIFPNPATDYINITTKDAVVYSIYDSMGRSVKQGMLSNGQSIYIADLQQGVYFISITNKAQLQGTFKLVKE
ncbi:MULTISPECIES: T9SS type A sorting domain-containing protein [Aequorivita]|uniref:T9SS type A sorting domain-containing protein n=2 Tax=Aequorivita TaxID=153265 RepID=A0AB35YV43_9FLAO|nr:T9SS type A sorting domain-containing protein [Aequorivita sp. Ant34-E75]WGF94086.1 T9SS type A sorting domain-containing protein [Aequorivita sp. Ant34-E75]